MNFHISFVEKVRWRLKSIEHKFLQYRLTTNESAIAETEYGKVKGVKRLTIYDQPYYSFEGIPYAQPPVGELRFKAPQRPTPWEGIKDCTTNKDRATQVLYITNKVEGSEDCLYLNVYTNNLSPQKARPVMVWLHGGGWICGEADRENYGPDYFMQQDVILVTVQYRLGCLGFLSLDSPTLNVPGNAGLKDQVMALKWIKNNCASFGGDPDCITVFGESAGGASTHYMMLTEQTQGLFHRGILMSGNSICPWASTDTAQRAFTLAKLAGYTGEDAEKDILEFLLNAKAKDLIRVEQKVLAVMGHQAKNDYAFGPCVEPYMTADCLLPKQPMDMLKTAWSNSIPRMMGNTSYEGLLWLPASKQYPQLITDMDTCIKDLPREIMDPDLESEENKANGLKIKKAHVTGDTPTADNFMDMCSYKNFWFPTHRLIQSHFAHGIAAPIYLYRFDFDSEELISPYRIMRYGRGVKGVSHADEVGYLFSTLLAQRMNKDSREYRTIERTVGIWVQFATTGNPYNEKINGMESLTWDPVKKTDKVYQCLNISDDLKIIDLPEMEKIKMWESCFDKKKELFI